MNTLIVSDVHLSTAFDEKKFLYLKGLFSSYDSIILNGDFWDGYLTTFDAFVHSPWKNLFPILKKKKTIYLYGNHDQERYCDTRTSLFSLEQKSFHDFKYAGQFYHVEHGHNLLKTMDGVCNLPRWVWYFANLIAQTVENILTKLKSPQTVLLKYANQIIKNKLSKMGFTNWYICGHTHCAEVDTKARFANSGFIQYGKVSYLIVDSSGLSLKTDHY